MPRPHGGRIRAHKRATKEQKMVGNVWFVIRLSWMATDTKAWLIIRALSFKRSIRATNLLDATADIATTIRPTFLSDEDESSLLLLLLSDVDFETSSTSTTESKTVSASTTNTTLLLSSSPSSSYRTGCSIAVTAVSYRMSNLNHPVTQTLGGSDPT
jgi:hypothetical protein